MTTGRDKEERQSAIADAGAARVIHQENDSLEDERAALLFMLEDLERSREQIKQAHHEWLDALDAIHDPVFMHDKEYRVMRSNRAYAERARLSVKEVVGKPYYDLFPKRDDPLPRCDEATREGRNSEEEFQLETGEIFLSRASSIKDEDGRYLYSLHIMEDITERKRVEQSLLNLNRALKTLSTCNRELVHASDEPQLLQAMCRVIVELGGYRMAWVGYLEDDAEKSIHPVAQDGYEEGYLENAHISWADTERGRGPTGRAGRSGQIQVAANILTDPSLAPWRAEASKRGYASSIALPLSHEGKVFGVLTIYAIEADAFSQDEVSLLQEMAEDMAFGIQTMRLRQEQKQVMEKLRLGMEKTVQVISAMVEIRDPYTAGHEMRVAELATAIAMEMGLPEEQVQGIHLAGTIHDLGKIQAPAEILSKPGRLTEVEFSLIKQHSQTGYEILKNIEFPWPIAQMVLQHHERMDGSGYPQGLKGDAILPEARILAVADVVEAMASHRPYRPGLGVSAALDEITKNRGVFYDPDVVDACVRLFKEKNYTLVEVLGKR